jgi:excisionase family DNA binding protein
LLGIARGVAYESVRTGAIPATRVGRRWLIPRRRFHAWLDGTPAERSGAA